MLNANKNNRKVKSRLQSVKMILKYFFLFVIACVAKQSIALAQNLVPNPSFEDTVACPNALSQIDRAIGWNSYKESPDYFNACSSPSAIPSVSVPYNQWGYQYARTGNAYAGLITYVTPGTNLREYIGIQLSQSLVIGQTYYGSFYVNRPVSHIPYINIATNKIGMRLSTVPYSFGNPVPNDNYAQIYTDSIMTDTLNWVKISGSFIADSAYSHLSIGNFFVDSLTSYIRFDSTSNTAYYYIEDVVLSTDSNCCGGQGIFSIEENNILKIFPNPASDWIIIEGRDLKSISVFDVLGKQCIERILANPSLNEINLGDLPRGVYLIKIKTSNKFITQKIIIN